MKLLCLIFLAATICLVGQAFAENEHATTPVLPWQSQLAPRAENLPPGARAWPIFARETFVFPPRTNDPSDKLLSVVIAPLVAPKLFRPPPNRPSRHSLNIDLKFSGQNRNRRKPLL